MEERRRHNTVRQLEILVEFMETHRDLALGRVRSKEARAVAQRLWRECAESLNALGPSRTGKEWSKVWNDLKTKVRSKLISINANQRATGGGPSSAPTLTPLEERTANIIGRDIGPLPNVAQDHFAGDGSNVVVEEGAVEEVAVEEVVEEEVVEESQPLSPPIVLNIPAESQPEEMPEVVEQIPLPESSEPFAIPEDRRRMVRRRARVQRPARASAQSPAPPRESDLQQPTHASTTMTRMSLEESRAMVLRIEEMRAQAALQNAQSATVNAQAFNTLSEAFKLLAESVDRLTQQYCAAQERERNP